MKELFIHSRVLAVFVRTIQTSQQFGKIPFFFLSFKIATLRDAEAEGLISSNHLRQVLFGLTIFSL